MTFRLWRCFFLCPLNDIQICHFSNCAISLLPLHGTKAAVFCFFIQPNFMHYGTLFLPRLRGLHYWSIFQGDINYKITVLRPTPSSFKDNVHRYVDFSSRLSTLLRSNFPSRSTLTHTVITCALSSFSHHKLLFPRTRFSAQFGKVSVQMF